MTRPEAAWREPEAAWSGPEVAWRGLDLGRLSGLQHYKILHFKETQHFIRRTEYRLAEIRSAE